MLFVAQYLYSRLYIGIVWMSRMNSKKVRPIVVRIETKEALDAAKIIPEEPYNSVIRRALKALAEASKK